MTIKLGDYVQIRGYRNDHKALIFTQEQSYIDEWMKTNINTNARLNFYKIQIIGMIKKPNSHEYNTMFQHNELGAVENCCHRMTSYFQVNWNLLSSIDKDCLFGFCDLDMLTPLEVAPVVIHAQSAKPVTSNEQFEKDKKFFFPDLCNVWISPGVSGLKYL